MFIFKKITKIPKREALAYLNYTDSDIIMLINQNGPYQIKRIPLASRDPNSQFSLPTKQTLKLAEPLPRQKKTRFSKEDTYFPVPRGESYYAQAKKAEYIQKDLLLAESLYLKAIETEDRVESAVKDLAGVYHEQNKTSEAIELLKNHRKVFTEEVKYQNLLQNLNRQVVEKGNRLNKFLKISNLPPLLSVPELFDKPSRIENVEIYEDYCILKFTSHSAARKTLESFKAWETCKVEWVSITGDIAGDAVITKEIEHIKDKELFLYRVFLKENEERALPVDKSEAIEGEIYEFEDQEAELLIGSLEEFN